MNTSNESTPSAREYIEYSGTSGTTVLITTRNVDSSNSALTHAVGSIVEFIPDVTWADRIYDALSNVVNVDTLAVDTSKVATPATVASSSIVLSGSNYFSASGATISTIKDDDTFATASDTSLATSESIKAYVDGKKATGAEVTTGTEDAKYVTPKSLTDAEIKGPAITTGFTQLTSNFTAATNTSEQVVTGLTTTITDIGKDMIVYASASLSITMGTTGNNEVRLYINTTEVAHWYRLSATTDWHIHLSGISAVSTGSNVTVQVRVISDNSTAQIVYGTGSSRGRSNVSVMVFPA